MPSAGNLLTRAAADLAQAGVGTGRLDAEVLLAHALRQERGRLLLHPGRPVSKAEEAAFRKAVTRRARREPVARITGQQEFWSLPFLVGPATLIPRHDSETLIEEVLAALGPGGRERPWRVLDLGTGSGCLLLALLSELPRAAGLGADASAGALIIAATNARVLGFSKRAAFARFDWTGPAPSGMGRFDIILCNPPYIPSGELATLPPEVAGFDPAAALDGGADGLDHYRAVIGILPGLAGAEGALAVFEVGQGQAGPVKDLLGAAGAKRIRLRQDLAGIERAVAADFPGGA